MTYHRAAVWDDIPEHIMDLRKVNFREFTEDRMRCQRCQSFYWRLWYDLAQCLGCGEYTVIEVGQVDPDQLKFDFAEEGNYKALLQVQWIREQLYSKKGIDVSKRVTDPLTDRTEFIIFANRLRCRVTGSETLLEPKITGYWITCQLPEIKGNVLTAEQALDLVKKNKEE